MEIDAWLFVTIRKYAVRISTSFLGEVFRPHIFIQKISGIQTLKLTRGEQQCLINGEYSQTNEKSPRVFVVYFPFDRHCRYSISLQSNLLLDTVMLDFVCKVSDSSNSALKYLVFPNRFLILTIDSDAAILVALQGELITRGLQKVIDKESARGVVGYSNFWTHEDARRSFFFPVETLQTFNFQVVEQQRVTPSALIQVVSEGGYKHE